MMTCFAAYGPAAPSPTGVVNGCDRFAECGYDADDGESDSVSEWRVG